MERAREEFEPALAERLSRLLLAGRFAAEWIAYFAVSFALTAGVLLAAHI